MVSFIDAHRDAYGVEPICEVLPIAPSTYYEHKAREADTSRLPPRSRREEALRAEIVRVWREHFEVYGVRKVWRQLNREGIEVARCTVARLMGAMGLYGVVRGKKLKTTRCRAVASSCGSGEPRLPRLSTERAVGVGSDYVATWRGFVYVAFVIDAYSRRIVGWRVSSSLRTDLALDALEQALYDRAVSGAVRLDPLHRAPGRSGDRAVSRKHRRLLRQRAGRID